MAIATCACAGTRAERGQLAFCLSGQLWTPVGWPQGKKKRKEKRKKKKERNRALLQHGRTILMISHLLFLYCWFLLPLFLFLFLSFLFGRSGGAAGRRPGLFARIFCCTSAQADPQAQSSSAARSNAAAAQPVVAGQVWEGEPKETERKKKKKEKT